MVVVLLAVIGQCGVGVLSESPRSIYQPERQREVIPSADDFSPMGQGCPSGRFEITAEWPRTAGVDVPCRRLHFTRGGKLRAVFGLGRGGHRPPMNGGRGRVRGAGARMPKAGGMDAQGPPPPPMSTAAAAAAERGAGGPVCSGGQCSPRGRR